MKTLDDFRVTTFADADAGIRDQFKALVLALTPELDDEDGADLENGPWPWVIKQNDQFPPDGPYATFLFLDCETGRVVATASFVRDDRKALENAGVPAFGVWAFVNVLDRDLRGQGVGRVICQYLDDHVQAAVNNQSGGDTQDVYLFSEEPGDYARWGFEETGRTVPFLDHEEPLCRKVYQAAA